MLKVDHISFIFRKFRYLVDLKEVVSAEGEKVEAHSEARTKLEQYLQYHCWTVKRVKEFYTRRQLFNKEVNKKSTQTFKNNKIDEDNVGFLMLKNQGWSGGAIGSNSDGILEPLGFNLKDDRKGVGFEDNRPEKIPLEAFMYGIKQYANGSANYDLVFSTTFSKHEVLKLKE
jgi:hypothetical protein